MTANGQSEAALREYAALIELPPPDESQRATEHSAAPHSVVERLRLSAALLSLAVGTLVHDRDEHRDHLISGVNRHLRLQAQLKPLQQDVKWLKAAFGLLCVSVIVLLFAVAALLTLALVSPMGQAARAALG